MTSYLIAVLDADDAANPRYLSGEVVPSSDVTRRMRELLGSHALSGDAQMREQAESAGWRLDRWRGEPARFCGFLTRYDLYPVQDGSHASEREWREHARQYELEWRYSEARERMAAIGIGPDDPDFKPVQAWLAGQQQHRIGDRARDLAVFRDLAVRGDIAPHLSAYRPWQWSLATAKTGDSPAQVERELLAEIAQRQAAGSR